MSTLRKWLADNGYELAANASDDDVKAAAKQAMIDDKLSMEKYAELRDADTAKAKSAVDEAEDRLVAKVTKANQALLDLKQQRIRGAKVLRIS